MKLVKIDSADSKTRSTQLRLSKSAPTRARSIRGSEGDAIELHLKKSKNTVRIPHWQPVLHMSLTENDNPETPKLFLPDLAGVIRESLIGQVGISRVQPEHIGLSQGTMTRCLSSFLPAVEPITVCFMARLEILAPSILSLQSSKL